MSEKSPNPDGPVAELSSVLNTDSASGANQSKAYRTLSLFWQTSVAAEMEYRLNFVLAVFSALSNLAGGLFGLWLLFRKQSSIGNWSFDEALLVFGMYTLLRGFSTTLLRPNLSQIVKHVEQGTLDFILLKPIDSQFWLSTRMVSLWGFPDLFLGLGVLGYACVKLEVTGLGILQAIPCIVMAMILLYSLWFVLGATSIWFVKIYNVTEVLRRMLEAGRFPGPAFPYAWQLFFTIVVPVIFMTTVPAEALLQRLELSRMALTAALACGAFFFSRWFWRFALRFYTSASS